MEKPVEFSQFFRLFYSAKEGDGSIKEELNSILSEYESSENSESELHELGQAFIHVGVLKLYEYVDSEDINYIGNLEKEAWDSLAEKNQEELPSYLANAMIKYAKENQLSNTISIKWGCKKKLIDKNIMQMARYITEGFIDVLE